MATRVMTKVKIETLRNHVEKAFNGKLFRNFSICGFLITCPKNGSNAKINYNARVVGEIDLGSMSVYKYDQKVWRNDAFKYDILCEIQQEISGADPDKENTEEIPDKKRNETTASRTIKAGTKDRVKKAKAYLDKKRKENG